MLRQWRDKTDEFEVEADSEDFKKTVQYAEDDFNRVVMMEDLVVWVAEDSKYIPIYSWIFEFPKFSWFSLFIGRHVVEEMLLMDKFENDFIMKIKFISLDANNNHIILGLSLMENGSLLSFIKANNEIRTTQALEWAYNIAEGLHYLNSKHNAMG